ncbi:spermidine synthase [Streptomyces aidingensis]|uniref:Spermidine synthase n=1 Tax=Streptomyces aidingensis TaxID=910347 RepID=A0A1I1Q285_9ACTN|nr:spermidine synthase [Streptomyces aidingensis]
MIDSTEVPAGRAAAGRSAAMASAGDPAGAAAGPGTGTGAGEDDGRPLILPVRPVVGRWVVLSAVFVCAACGLVYELVLVALADYLVGDTVTQTSVVLSLMVFAMGLGSLGAKRLRLRASRNFGLIEALLALAGGGSAIALHACWLWFGEVRPVLFGCALAIGVLIGAEMPLLMTLIQRIRKQDPGGAVADLSAADYVGALLGGLAFPFLLLPFLGRLNAALLTGVVNVLAGGAVVLWLFRGDLGGRARLSLFAVNTAVAGALITGALLGGPLEAATARAVEDRPAAETAR